VIVAAALAAALVGESPALAQSCANGEGVVMLLGSSEFIRDGQKMHQQMYLSAIHNEFDVSAPQGERVELWVSNLAEFKSQIEQVSRRCRIKYIMIATHASPGALTFSPDTRGEEAELLQLDGTLVSKLAPLAAALAPGATVKLAGCSAAARCDGENFAAAVAQTLLARGGGMLEAERSDQNSLGGLTRTFGMRASHKIRVAVGGALHWDREPIPHAQCREILATHRNRLLSAMPRCTSGEVAGIARDLGSVVEGMDRVGDRLRGALDLALLARYNSEIDRMPGVHKRFACLANAATPLK